MSYPISEIDPVMTKLSITGPILAIDIGIVFTQAFLFEKAGERYCLTGVGKAPTTSGKLGKNVKFGVRLAIEEVQALTGRILLNATRDLIHPVSRDGDGIDQCILTISTGQCLKILVAGLTNDNSLENGWLVANLIEASVIKVINLEDNKKPEDFVDEILDFQPDIIILCGVLDVEPARQDLQFFDPVRFAYFQFTNEYRPQILYLGDQSVQPSISSLFNNSAGLYFSNVRHPQTMDELLQIEPLITTIALNAFKSEQVGLEDIISWTGGNVFLSHVGLMKILHCLARNGGSEKGVLSVDVSDSSAKMVAEYHDQFSTSDVIDFGNDFGLTNYEDWLPQIWNWLTMPELDEENLLEFLLNKAIYPTTLPESKTDGAIQNALLRVILQRTTQQVSARLPVSGLSMVDRLSKFEPILITGNLLTDIANPGRLCLTLLDGIQPTGITSFIVDWRHIAKSLGSIAGVFPELTMQILDSKIFTHLATVISPVGNAPAGAPILRIRFSTDDGVDRVMDVKQGELEVIPLPRSRISEMQLQPFHRFDIGMGGAGRGGLLRVMGSELGLVIDARSRPLVLPEKPIRRSEIYRKWHWMLSSD